MSRSVAQIKAELEDLFPPYWSNNPIGSAILTGIATVLASREAAFDAVDGWREQMLRQLADGIYLDEHAAQVGKERRPGETDEELRPRAVFSPTILTGGNQGGNVVPTLSAFLPDGYSVVAEEPYQNTLDAGFFLSDTSSLLTSREAPESKFLGWIFIPIPEVIYIGGTGEMFLGVDAFLDDSHLDESILSLERQHIRQILEAVEELKGYGIGIGVTVLDLASEAHYALVVRPPLGGYV